jgi:hypothetical protein
MRISFDVDKMDSIRLMEIREQVWYTVGVVMPWSSIQEPLASFLETMVDLPEDVRSVAIEVADLYGRYNPDKFRGVWEKLRVQTKN